MYRMNGKEFEYYDVETDETVGLFERVSILVDLQSEPRSACLLRCGNRPGVVDYAALMMKMFNDNPDFNLAVITGGLTPAQINQSLASNGLIAILIDELQIPVERGMETYSARRGDDLIEWRKRPLIAEEKP